MDIQGLINKLVQQYNTDELVLGLVLVGSVAKGYHDEHSDIDLEIVVTEERYYEQKKHHQTFIHTSQYDLSFTTMDKLQRLKNSERDEEHWAYQDCQVLLDKTGKLKEILEQIAKFDTYSRTERLKRYYLGYWQNMLASMACAKRHDSLAAKIYAAYSMRGLIRLLFNFNYRWAPKLQWAFKELPLLQKKPKNLEAQVISILEKPDSNIQSKLWDEIAELLREEEYSWVDHPEEIL
ncbi:MAG: nucleotidyltransferase domain-containing protein [Candidatus Hermodarchaeota archaeon]